MPCHGCHKEIEEKQMLKCSACRCCWHYPCIGYTDTEFTKILPMNKVKWRCADCKSKTGKKNVPSPQPQLQPQFQFDCSPVNSQVNSPQLPPPPLLPKAGAQLAGDQLQPQHESIINLDTNALITFFNTKLEAMRAESSEAMMSVQSKLDNLTQTAQKWESTVSKLNDAIKSLQDENLSLRQEILSLRENQDDTEQRARQCNLDIQNIPEEKSENLLNLVENIGTLIGVPLPSTSVVAVHRVARGQATPSNRPRSIIVQLATKRLRDDVIAAARARRGLTTDQLQLGVPSTKFYINEHLTLKNKILFARTRSIARAKNYKFVWVRNLNIMAKKDDNSRVTVIRRETDLEKL